MNYLPVPFICLLFFILSSCKKCEECYLIEEDNGTKVESPIGEFCNDEIDEQENKEFTSTSPAHVECR